MPLTYVFEFSSTSEDILRYGLIIAFGVWSGFGVLESRSADASAGPAVFTKYCIPCHGKDGRARTPVARILGVKDLTKSTTTDEEIAKQIRQGKKDADGKQKMPPFDDKLSEAEIKALVEIVKKLRKTR